MAIVETGGRALGKNTGWLREGYGLKWGCGPAHQLHSVRLVIIFPGTRQPRCKSQGEYGLTYLGRCRQRTEGKTVDSRKRVTFKMAHGFDGVKEQMLQGWKWESQKAVRWSMKAGGCEFMISEVERYPMMVHQGCLEYGGNEVTRRWWQWAFRIWGCLSTLMIGGLWGRADCESRARVFGERGEVGLKSRKDWGEAGVNVDECLVHRWWIYRVHKSGKVWMNECINSDRSGTFFQKNVTRSIWLLGASVSLNHSVGETDVYHCPHYNHSWEWTVVPCLEYFWHDEAANGVDDTCNLPLTREAWGCTFPNQVSLDLQLWLA